MIRTFVTESSVYRVSKNIDETIQNNLNEGKEKGKATIEGIAQYAIEAAFLKVFGSEALNFVVDEAVQIFGGMGFSAETDIDRAYRDSRINRIFEGTNEINRLLVVDTTIKKALKEGFDVIRYANYIINELSENLEQDYSGLSYYDEKKLYIKNFKKAVLLLLGVVSEKFKRQLVTEQEILFNISDIIMQVYSAESTLLRVEKLEQMKGEEAIMIYKDILDVFVYDAAGIIYKSGIDAVNSFAEGEEQKIMLRRIDYFTKQAPVNVKNARRRIADKLIEDNRYNF